VPDIAWHHSGMRPLAETCGIYLLGPQHLPKLQQYASDPAIAATTRLPHPFPPDGAEQFLAQVEHDRAARTGQVFAIEDRGAFVGVVGLHAVRGGGGEIGYGIGKPHWGCGYATFGVTWLLPYCFQNCGLDRVGAHALVTNMASLRVLEKLGFVRGEPGPHGQAKWPASVLQVPFTLTARQWRAHRDAPALALLHPTLRTLLDRELAAGNEVKQAGRGWPDADSVVVTLRERFRAMPSPLPEGVEYDEPNDPHWWRAELRLQMPRQLLVW
jgi:ribosomal-protein-alanine N-acetyltransferase